MDDMEEERSVLKSIYFFTFTTPLNKFFLNKFLEFKKKLKGFSGTSIYKILLFSKASRSIK